MKSGDLRANPRNPRRIKDDRLEALRDSMLKFGDLGGIVYNRRTKRLIGGHQRQKGIPPEATIKVEHRYESPNQCMTVAVGYVELGGERFKYREVDAPEQWETEAMFAANKHGGEWDDGLVRVALADFPAMDLRLAGFSIEAPRVDVAGPQFSADKSEQLHRDQAKDEKKEPEQSDEQYVRDTPQSTEEIDTQPTHVDSRGAFDAVKENTEVAGRRIVIIIDCPTDAIKAELKEKLRQPVEAAGAKFF